MAFTSLVALKTAVLIHKYKLTFLAVKHCQTFIKKSVGQFKVAILEQLHVRVARLRISILFIVVMTINFVSST